MSLPVMPFWKRALAGAAALGLLIALAASLFAGIGWLLSPAAPHAEDEAPAPGAAAALEADLVAAVARVKPAVVSINVSTTVTIPGRRFSSPFEDDPFFRDFLGRHFQFDVPERRFEQQGVGSGVVISSDGYIVTNWHVVGRADKIQIRLADGRQFEGKVVGSDRSTDVALVKIEAEDLPTAPLGRSAGIEVGRFVFAVGTPFDPGLAQTVTFGIVSATGRAREIEEIEDFIQTDAAINPGNSGGPLCNIRGEVIGLNTAIRPVNGGNSGVGFAIPIDLARRVVDDIREHGEFRRGYLGVRIRTVRPEEAAALGLDRPYGAVVEHVEPGSPAAGADVRESDVIVRFGGTEVHDSKHLQALVARQRPGARVELSFLRAKAPLSATVEVAVYRATAGGEKTVFGVRVEALGDEERKALGIEAGVQVVEVEAASPAARAGLEPGDVILQANRKDILTPGDLEEALRDAEAVLLLVRDRRTGRVLWMNVDLP